MSALAARKPRIYKRPDPTAATGVFREFRARISCNHAWEPNIILADGKVIATINPGEICWICQATCKRDPLNRIVEFSTKEEVES